jgi:FKBP-type peptidyl-prolyl cis-trans isomerase FkpA
MIKKIAYILLVTASLFSCKDDRQQWQIDAEALDIYISDNNIEATKNSYGFYYTIIAEGNDTKPYSNSTVSVKYKGELTDGTVFDDSEGSIRQFYLPWLVDGWQYGLPLIGEGGRIKLYLPGYLGYGSQDSEDIPANSILIFDIQLIRVAD